MNRFGHLGTAPIQLKKSTDFPTTTASMNMAMPMGSFSSMSISSIAREIATEAVP